MTHVESLLEVYLSPEGEVCIAQRDMAEDCFVEIEPEEIDLLVGWLKEKQQEAFALRRAKGIR